MSSPVESRRAEIVTTVREHGHARVDDLAQRLGVSIFTIPRGLDALPEDGLIERARGAAEFFAPHFAETNVSTRRETNIAVNKALAAHVAAFINAGDIVALDDST